MLNKKIVSALNKQIVMEAMASSSYLAMAVWCDVNKMEGCAKFMFRQSEEERAHMMKLVNYLLESGDEPIVPALGKPNQSYKDVVQVFKSAYKQELAVSKSINAISTLALQVDDPQTHQFMQWFVLEQLEEEALFRRILDKIELIGKGGQWLYYIDQSIEQINQEVVANESGE